MKELNNFTLTISIPKEINGKKTIIYGVDLIRQWIQEGLENTDYRIIYHAYPVVGNMANIIIDKKEA